jgi:DNA polymerase, archaea type
MAIPRGLDNNSKDINDLSAGIVSVALAGDSGVEIYQRDNEIVRSYRREFQPWLVVGDNVAHDQHNASSVVKLNGEASFNTMLTFFTWTRWRSVYQALRDNPGSPVLAFPNPAEQFMIASGLTQFKGIEFDQLRRAQLDIETTGLDPKAEDARIVMIAAAINGENATVLRGDELSEAEMLAALTTWLRQQDPDVIEGHNIFNFDIPYLVARARANNRALSWGRDGSALRQAGTRRFKAGARTIPFESAYVRGRHIVDTYQQIQRYDYAGLLHSYGLKQSIEALGLTRSDRTHVAGADISRVWRDDPNRLEQYAIDDLRDTDTLSRLSLPTEFYQARILPSSLQDVATGGPGEKVNDLLVRAYVARSESIPAPGPSRAYPGGYTEVRRVGIFSPVVKCDVESLYPAIMLSDSIAPSSDRLNVFLPLLETLTTERLEAKRKSAITSGHERARWEGLQSSLKVLINSFYGYLGYSRGYFNDFEAAERVTLRGHRIIRQVTESLEEHGALTIEIDTDGVYFEPPVGTSSFDQEASLITTISDTLDAGINLAHDGRWQAMLSLRLKNYALLGHDDRLYLKGSSLRSRRDEVFLRQFIEDTARAFLSRQAQMQARTIYLDAAKRIQQGLIEPAQIARTETITDSTFKSQATRRLAEAIGSERIGERVAVYQRDNGEIARIEAYAGDEDRQYLLRRLRAAAERFRPLYETSQAFDFDFPVVTLRTDLNTLNNAQKVDQMRLF